MSQPTVKEIADIIYEDCATDLFDDIPGEISRRAAEKIHTLFHPVRKPLSELAESDDDLHGIFKLVSGIKSDYCSTLIEGDGTIWGFFGDRQLEISLNGRFRLFNGSRDLPLNCSVFELVRFINNLGYDAITETT